MIIVVDAGRGKPCLVYQIRRDGFSAKAKTYCNAETTIGTNGAFQLPDSMMKGLCDGCTAQYKQLDTSNG